MSVDIVNLIESNPITKFSGDYQSKLVEKVKNNFTNYEQQLFLSSFYCYLKHDQKNDFVIDLDNVWKWIGFGQKVKAKVLLENNFEINKDYKKLLSHMGKQDDKIHGGHNKEIFMLNIYTFKKFCLKAGTKKADEVHDYFIKLENIMFEITKEESEQLKKQVLQLENKNKEMEEKIIKAKELDNEKFLLKEYATSGPLVYVIKVKTFENGTYIIKIGESRKGIQSRYNEHKCKYDESGLKKKRVVKEKKEKVVKEKVVKEKKYVAKLPEKGELKYIAMEDMKFVKLCLKNPCGKKVMCFVVEYQGNEYVLKEGKKSMNYNEDYEVVDSLKEIFGLNHIGMRRIFSNKAMVKVDDSKMEWCDNWKFVEKEDIVYSMMSYIPGVRFNHSKNITRELELEYMKIGLFRGITMASDFNVTNVFELEGKLYSMDEHDILGKRVHMIGQKNMRYYKKYESELSGIFEDLYRDIDEKKERIVEKLKSFKYEQFADRIISNYYNLSNRFYEEFNESK